MIEKQISKVRSITTILDCVGQIVSDSLASGCKAVVFPEEARCLWRTYWIHHVLLHHSVVDRFESRKAILESIRNAYSSRVDDFSHSIMIIYHDNMERDNNDPLKGIPELEITFHHGFYVHPGVTETRIALALGIL